MRNKYEKLMDSLQELIEKEYDKYVKEANELNKQIKNTELKYNDQIGVINPLRHDLRTEINCLYGFLKGLGEVGKTVGVFEFLLEGTRGEKIEDNLDDEGLYPRKNISKFAKGVKFITKTVIPISGFFFRKKDKDAYTEMLNNFENRKIEWKNDLNNRRADLKFYKTAIEIADMYRSIIAMVKDAIDTTILPELSGIEAFLNAVAIKESIISGRTPNHIIPAKINEFDGTLFDCHYVFVMNCFDYYKTITTFFTKTILTNIIEDKSITKNERETFELEIKEIEESTEKLKSMVRFGGGQ